MRPCDDESSGARGADATAAIVFVDGFSSELPAEKQGEIGLAIRSTLPFGSTAAGPRDMPSPAGSDVPAVQRPVDGL